MLTEICPKMQKWLGRCSLMRQRLLPFLQAGLINFVLKVRTILLHFSTTFILPSSLFINTSFPVPVIRQM